jgi:hypothetical protein
MASLGNVDVVKAMQYATLTVKLTRTKEMRFRIWCAVQLMRFTSWLLNCNIEFENK